MDASHVCHGVLPRGVTTTWADGGVTRADRDGFKRERPPSLGAMAADGVWGGRRERGVPATSAPPRCRLTPTPTAVTDGDTDVGRGCRDSSSRRPRESKVTQAPTVRLPMVTGKTTQAQRLAHAAARRGQQVARTLWPSATQRESRHPIADVNEGGTCWTAASLRPTACTSGNAEAAPPPKLHPPPAVYRGRGAREPFRAAGQQSAPASCCTRKTSTHAA